MVVTKSELKDFIDSYGEIYRIEEKSLATSLCELHEIIYRYFLFGMPNNYTLTEWEYRECLKMSECFSNGVIDLEPYFISFIRNRKLNILNG